MSTEVIIYIFIFLLVLNCAPDWIFGSNEASDEIHERLKKDIRIKRKERRKHATVSIDANPGLNCMYEAWLDELRKIQPPNSKRDKRFRRSIVRDYFKKSKGWLTQASMSKHTEIEKFLVQNSRRPFGPEDTGGRTLNTILNPWASQWSYRFGKYSRRSFKKRILPSLAFGWKKLFGTEIQEENISGFFYYPPGGFREWHTNRWDGCGYRLYLVHTETCTGGKKSVGSSGMNLIVGYDQERVQIKDTDRTANLFEITKEPPLWHSVWSNQHRYSLGLKLNAVQAMKIRQMAQKSIINHVA